jgi:NADH dehydrogenase
MSVPTTRKIVLCGAGFLGGHIARVLATNPKNRILLASRNPKSNPSNSLSIPEECLLPSAAVDITNPSSLTPHFKSAHTVVSLVGVLYGSPKQFDDIQWKGAENVARAAKEAGARLVHVSAIGADKNSKIPYFRTKGLGEEAVFRECPSATVLRPSLVFGPGDGFFARFAKLAAFLPLLPVFGGGTSRFQPVFAGDIGRVVEICTRANDEKRIAELIEGKIIGAGGLEVFTYREMMQLVLQYSNRRRPIISLPFAVGYLQGLVMEWLPPNILTVTRAQVEQLKSDNILDTHDTVFKDLLHMFAQQPPTGAHKVLPTYLGL